MPSIRYTNVFVLKEYSEIVEDTGTSFEPGDICAHGRVEDTDYIYKMYVCIIL